MAISQNNQEKVLATKAFLLDIIKNSAEFKSNSELIKQLKSQGGLAKQDIPDLGIFPCSLNTLKTASESLLDRGFRELDELRINAREEL